MPATLIQPCLFFAGRCEEANAADQDLLVALQ